MKVIHFPGADNINSRTPRIKKEELPYSQQTQLIIGEASFTCPKCSNKTKLTFDGMIFRSMDFHCSKCGTRHKVSNPAFNTTPSEPRNRTK